MLCTWNTILYIISRILVSIDSMAILFIYLFGDGAQIWGVTIGRQMFNYCAASLAQTNDI